MAQVYNTCASHCKNLESQKGVGLHYTLGMHYLLCDLTFDLSWLQISKTVNVASSQAYPGFCVVVSDVIAVT